MECSGQCVSSLLTSLARNHSKSSLPGRVKVGVYIRPDFRQQKLGGQPRPSVFRASSHITCTCLKRNTTSQRIKRSSVLGVGSIRSKENTTSSVKRTHNTRWRFVSCLTFDSVSTLRAAIELKSVFDQIQAAEKAGNLTPDEKKRLEEQAAENGLPSFIQGKPVPRMQGGTGIKIPAPGSVS